jgi:hypothetical protein
LDIHVVSTRNNVHIGVGIASCLQDVLKAEGEKEHAAGIPLTHAALRQEGRGVRRRSANEEVSVLAVNPPGEWVKLGGAAGNSGKYGGTGDLVERIAEIHLNRDASRVCTNARTEGVSERRRPARDPPGRTRLQRSQARPNIRSGVHDADAKETEPCFTHSERAATRLLEGNKVGGAERRDVWQGALKSSGVTVFHIAFSMHYVCVVNFGSGEIRLHFFAATYTRKRASHRAVNPQGAQCLVLLREVVTQLF